MRPPIVFVFVALAACNAAPPPSAAASLDVEVPDRWQAPAEPAEPTPSGEPSEQPWWHGFGDPRLDAAIVHALEHNRDLRAAAARLDAAAAQATIAGATILPSLDLGLNGSRNRRNFIGFPIPGGGKVLSTTSTSLGVSLDLSWELDLWGRVRAGQSAALAEVQATAADLHGARLSVVGQTCKAYFAVVEARAQLALAESTLASWRATADDVRDRYRRGVRPALDAHLAEANAENAAATQAQRREQLHRAVRQLEILLGRYPAGSAEAAAGLPERIPPVPAGLPSELLQRRPDLAAAERRLAASGARVDQARAALYPRLSLTAGGGTQSRDAEDLIDPDFRVWSLGANLLAPLFHGGALRADVLRTEAVQQEALAGYGGAVLRAFSEVESALAAEADLMRREQGLRAASGHATAAAELARSRYQSGLEDFLAIAESQRQAFVSESAALGARRLRLENRIDLFLALGGGFESPGADGEPKP